MIRHWPTRSERGNASAGAGGVRVRNRHLTALAAALCWVFALVAPSAQAQYTQGLPAGILNVEVDGQPIDAITVPITNNPSPEISGRVDLGVPTIELAIADGEVIRFPAALDERGRFRVAVPQRLSDGQYSLYINDLLIGAFAIEGAAVAPEEREPGRLLDIARVVPYPGDFADAIPGLGLLDGRFFTIEEEAQRTAAAASNGTVPDARDAQRRLAEAGWLQRYESRLAAPSPDDPSTFSAQISSFVVEYASGADARSAFAALVGDAAGVEFSTVGNESSLTLLSGVTPDTGVEYQAARLIFRVGPMLGVIVYADLLNQQPDLALLDVVAQAVAARGVFVADRQVVPLGSMALRLDPAAATSNLIRRDVYDVRGGTLTAMFNEDEATLASRVETLSGTTDAFASTTIGTFAERGRPRNENREDRNQPAAEAQEAANPTPTSVISIEGEEPAEAPASPTPETSRSEVGTPEPEARATAQAFMVSALYAFPGEAEADAWLVTQRDRLNANPESGGATFSGVTDAPALGDAAAAFATARPTGNGDEVVNGYRIYSRVGAIVAVLDFGSIPEISLRAAASLMEQQLACITAQGCPGPASLPANLFGGREGRGAEGEPAGTPTTAEPTEPTPGSVIIIEGEGEGSAPAETRVPREDREPRPDRERRRDREQQGEEASGEAAG
jgi:hypothetical protein